MTKLSYDEVRTAGIWNQDTKQEVLATTQHETNFANLKNKADGVRRIGYRLTLTKFTNAKGLELFRGEYQTTLNGDRYQSGKDTDYYTTQAEVEAHLAKTVKGAVARYAKLALNPASKIEKRWEQI